MAGPVQRAVEQDSPWPHRLALLTTIATFPLLFVGGLVTSTGSALAVPDWPTTFGHNMFLYPWSKMVGGILYEHSHRLIGSVVGLLTVLLALSLWYTESRQWLRWLGVAALGAVIAQGVLGGLRVVLLQQTLAIAHACFAQAFFALAASLTLLTSAEWRKQPVKKTAADAGRVQRLGLLTIGFLYLQLILGAILRHTGEWVDLHLVGAALVAIHVLLLSARVRRNHGDLPTLVHSATLLRNLLVLQLGLGVGAYLGKFTESGVFLNPSVVVLATSHVVVGALMLVTCLRLILRAYRLLDTLQPEVQPQLVSEQVPV
ncbi:MAG: COX15/CtaA family protein [Nitrospinae bacterium]|nr:COX15/CtaA family protein [Nitrospinota bacterium]